MGFPTTSDYSWTVETYLEKGLPPVDRVWTVGDFRKGQEVLEAACVFSAKHLPRFKSKHSGPVFARFISEENLAPALDESIDLELRISTAMGVFGAMHKLLPLYVRPQSKGERYDEERVEISSLRLKVVRVILKLKQSELDRLAEADPGRPEMEAKLDQLKGALSRIVINSLRDLEPDRRFRKQACITMAGYFNEIVPGVYSRLPERFQKDIAGRVRTLARSYPGSETARILDELAAKLP